MTYPNRASSFGTNTKRKPRRIALIGTFPPTRCGIASFTQDMLEAMRRVDQAVNAAVVAVTPPLQEVAYGPDVLCTIRRDEISDYQLTGDILNERGVREIYLQHEFGIFGGVAGAYILRCLDRAEADVVTTLHTVSTQSSPEQRRVIEGVLERSSMVVVMAERAGCILTETFGADPARIAVIPHGVPTRPFPDEAMFKAKIGLSGRKVLMTFGLIGRGKGLETMIAAMPAIKARNPEILYVILGATHPNVVASEGERYRAELAAHAKTLGVDANVLFIDRYASQAELIDYLSCADIYVTPYLNQYQITSGTLAYAYALGRPIVSTPYAHAVELLGHGRGVLCDFADSAAFASAVNGLLVDPAGRLAIGREAHESGKAMRWPIIGRRYLDLLDEDKSRKRRPAHARTSSLQARRRRPMASLDYLDSITDDTGLIQHSTMNVANRQEGYCVDDNARALLAISQHESLGRTSALTERLENIYVAFIQHSWNLKEKRFRNFMSFDRRWLDESGSEDSNGRTLHALAAARIGLRDPSRRSWADWLFHESIATADVFTSPRAIAHVVNALCLVQDGDPARADADRRLHKHATFLHCLLRRTATAEWYWFEDALAYENALLPGALINAARVLNDKCMMVDAIAALSWLSYVQKAEEGWFRPIGTGSIGVAKALPSQFDQQPVEAYATIAAYAAAAAADPDGDWRERAERVFEWFLGANDLASPLLDDLTYACCDGLHAHAPNANQGAESCLAAILSSLICEALAQTAFTAPTSIDSDMQMPPLAVPEAIAS